MEAPLPDPVPALNADSHASEAMFLFDVGCMTDRQMQAVQQALEIGMALVFQLHHCHPPSVLPSCAKALKRSVAGATSPSGSRQGNKGNRRSYSTLPRR